MLVIGGLYVCEYSSGRLEVGDDYVQRFRWIDAGPVCKSVFIRYELCSDDDNYEMINA